MNRPVHTRGRPAYPDLKAKFGEDPARFLYADLDPWPRLKTIEDPELLRAYARVEGERDESDGELIGWINCRIMAIDSRDDADEPASGGHNA